MSGVAVAAGAKILGLVAQAFPGGGFTILAVLSSSHCAVHSWPEYGLVTVELFACSSEMDRSAVARVVRDLLEADSVRVSWSEVCIPDPEVRDVD